jgi:SIR2-like domain
MMSRTKFKRDEIIILLGAGASVEAGIPASQGMIEEIEKLLASDDVNWRQHKDLYNYLKSSIYFADGIKGKFDGASYNVETLVNTLYELRRWEDHPLYPFVGAWNPKLLAVAGSDLKKFSDFRQRIVFKLRDDWVQLEYEKRASYYEGLVKFQKTYQHPLRVFTLNYDLCVEKGCSAASVERGFNDEHRWDWRRFSSGEGELDQKDIYLYKMHGSVDWTYDHEGFLIYFDNSSVIDPDKLAIIFGVTYKLQYLDPFLFFAYELRRWTLDQARLIITIGYGFADEHINGILKQSLDNNPKRKLLVVSPRWKTENEENDGIQRAHYPKALGIKDPDQVVWKPIRAGDFFTNHLKLPELGELFPEDEALFSEVSPPVLNNGESAETTKPKQQTRTRRRT